MPLTYEKNSSGPNFSRAAADRSGASRPGSFRTFSRILGNMPAQRVKVIQLQFASVNWNAMCTYNSGSAGQEVIKAFSSAGYILDEIPQKVIKLIQGSKFDHQRFGHMSGNDSGDGQQGQTSALIQECKTYLMGWARQNPKTESSGSSSGSTATQDDREKHEKDKETRKITRAKEKQESWEAGQESYDVTSEPVSRASEYLIEVSRTSGGVSTYPPKLNSEQQKIFDRLAAKDNK